MSYLGKTQLKASDIQLKAATTISGSSTNTVVLTWTAPNEQSLIFRVNGVTQNTTDFTIAGSPTTITLASGNFADASVVEVVGINDIGTTIVPADGSVTRPKLATTGTPDGSKFLQDDMAWTTVDSLPSQTGEGGKFLTTSGSAASWAAVAGGGLAGVQVYTAASSTWTKATREATLGVTITKVIVEVQGGGGSGSRHVTGTDVCSGSGSGYAKKFLSVANTTTATATVGAGGASQTSSNTQGNAGGLSSFVELVGTGSWIDVIGNGGLGGIITGWGIGPIGGTGTGGDITIQGGRGWMGGTTGGYRTGGSFLGVQGITTSQSGVSLDGLGYGAGGGGTFGGAASGAGAPGVVIVWEYQ